MSPSFTAPPTVTMSDQKHHIVFDVVGTCVSFESFYKTIDDVIGPRLQKYSINAAHFGYTWMTAAELEFSFLSMSSRYKPYREILSALFYRSLYMAGISNPRDLVNNEERDECVQGYSTLKIRDQVKEAFEILREGNFEVWCLTSGDLARVQGYFQSGDVEIPERNVVSCDSLGVAKPDLGAYRAMLDKLAKEKGKSEGQVWFAAAHMWDVSAAVKVGFRGAYCTELEGKGTGEIYEEEMDVVADGLVQMAKGIVRASAC
ncbi:Haloacid dehalogenase-like hydrolase-domain-containing protein [Aspergillus karnatakaensis]|uniref:putative 2-haloalkanoic acid dehalogenase n=1 Tax=Aspergillus karnatakaensis TaxID=1810916 RepID=UPI003CCD9A7F